MLSHATVRKTVMMLRGTPRWTASLTNYRALDVLGMHLVVLWTAGPSLNNASLDHHLLAPCPSCASLRTVRVYRHAWRGGERAPHARARR